MQRIFRQLRRPQLINFIKGKHYQLAPITSIHYPQLNLLTLVPKFNMSSRALHHKNIIKSHYNGKGFYVEQLFNGCLAIYSYYIESG